MPASILFLISDYASETASNDNHIRLPTAFTNCGWTVHIGAPERLTLNPDGLFIDGFALHQADLIWPLGFGPRQSYRAHLLHQLPQEKLINPIAEQVLGHGKAQWLEYTERYGGVYREIWCIQRDMVAHGGRRHQGLNTPGRPPELSLRTPDPPLECKM